MKRSIVLITLISFIFSIRIGYTAPLASNLTDQQSVSVTIYNSNIGLVKDTRLIDFKPGIHELKFMDVAAKIDPTTVHIKSLINGSSLNVLEQNYEYDLLSHRNFLKSLWARRSNLPPLILKRKKRRWLKQPSSPPKVEISFRLETKSILAIMGEFSSRESLRTLSPNPHWSGCWRINSQTSKLEASYLTSGINWKADYVAVLNKLDTLTDVTGWVTIDNRSGATYQNALLKLVAGDIHRVQEE